MSEPTETRPVSALSPFELSRLTIALLRAQLAECRAREAAASLDLLRIGAGEAARLWMATMAEIGAAHGVRLGETHTWDEVTGEIRAMR